MSPVDAMARFRAPRLVAPTGFDYFVVFNISSNYSHDLLAFTERTEKSKIIAFEPQMKFRWRPLPHLGDGIGLKIVKRP